MRPKYQRPEWERLLRDAEARGWRVTKGSGYFRLLCPCPVKHMKSVPLTPSGSHTLLNTVKWLEHHTCWEEQP